MKMPAMSSCKAGQHTYHLLLPRRLKHSDGILKRAWKRRPAIQHTKCCSRTYNGRPMSSLFGDTVFGLNQPIGHVLLGNRFRETVPGKPCTAACHFLERGCTVADIGAGGSAERNDRLTCEIVGFDGIVHQPNRCHPPNREAQIHSAAGTDHVMGRKHSRPARSLT